MRTSRVFRVLVLVGIVLLSLTQSAPAYAADADIVISEVGYNATCLGTDVGACGTSGTTENRFEWVEIYNKGGAGVNINTWQLCDNTDCDPLPDQTIGAGEYWIIAYNTTALQTEFNQYSPPYSVIPDQTISLDSQLGGAYGLANGADLVYILNGAEKTVDCVSWAQTAGTDCTSKTYVAGGGGLDTSLNDALDGQSIANIQGEWYEHGPSDAAKQASPYQANTAVGGSPTSLTLTSFTDSSPSPATSLPVAALVGLTVLAIGAALFRRKRQINSASDSNEVEAF